MANSVVVNKQGIPQVKDFIYGAVAAVVASLIPIIQAIKDSGHLQFDWGKIGTAAILGFIGYVLSKMSAKPSVKTIYDSNDAAKQVGNDIKKANEIS